jgi:tRNA A-37 threonylcarbamoyl transferase component Bud32
MRLTSSTLRKGDSCYTLTYVQGRELNANSLSKWFMEGTGASPLRLNGGSLGKRKILQLDDSTVVKETKFAFKEHDITARAEDLTCGLSPRVGACISDNSGAGVLTTQLIDGVPVNLVDPNSLGAVSKLAITNAVFYALGLLHKGDGKKSVIHGDPHIRNIILLNDSAHSQITSNAAGVEIRVIDLERARFSAFGRNMLPSLAFDLLTAANSLAWQGYMEPVNLMAHVEHYLDGLERLKKDDFLNAVRTMLASQNKLKFPDNHEIASCLG